MDSRDRLATSVPRGGTVGLLLKTLFWRLATLALRLPSPQLGLTTVFGMRTGVTRAIKHQNGGFNLREYETVRYIKYVEKEESTAPFDYSQGTRDSHDSLS